MCSVVLGGTKVELELFRGFASIERDVSQFVALSDLLKELREEAVKLISRRNGACEASQVEKNGFLECSKRRDEGIDAWVIGCSEQWCSH